MLKRMDDPVERVWEAIEAGDSAHALELAGKLSSVDTDTSAAFAVAVAHLEGGSALESHRRLQALGRQQLDPEEEHLRLFYLAQAAVALGEPREALDLLTALEPVDSMEEADITWWCGLCHDHLGDPLQADAFFSRSAQLAPEHSRQPTSVSPERVEQIVRDIVARLPAELRDTFEELPVVVQDLPSLDLIRKSSGAVAPDTLGLYTGANLFERSVMYFAGLPPTIYIYRRNLERFASTDDELVKEIETTLLHELGHHLGYDEDDLDHLGLA